MNSRRGTYSIVARDAASGELGVGVQSHWFSVGSVVPFIRAGVGAGVVQSVPDPGVGPPILDALARGVAAGSGLRAAMEQNTEAAAMRQTAVVDRDGRTAAWTGSDCIAFAGDVQGGSGGTGFSAQANMMLSPGVPEAMAAAFVTSRGRLAERILAALDAGEAAGGDVRGRQSAALVVVPDDPSAPEYAVTVDLRVDDHPDPLAELRRLLILHRAYELAGEADELVAQSRHAEAVAGYEKAARLAPDNDELLFWAGLSQGPDGGVDVVRAVIDRNHHWRDLLDRLGPHHAPNAATMREALDRE